MPEGVETPVPKSWTMTGPGYERHSHKTDSDELLGNAGPNVGYALKLVSRAYPDLHLSVHEHRHDVEPLIAEIAMRRAAHFGRAPIKQDVDAAIDLLGYDSTDDGYWRVHLVHDCGHDEHKRRAIVNSIPTEMIADSFDRGAINAWRKQTQDKI